jgi:hypothetical protein
MIIPMIILGDFNYQAASYTSTTTPSPLPILTQPSQKQWHEYINTHFHECTHSREAGHLLPTFRRGQVQSTIDYIYASPVLYQQLHSSSIDFIASDWTDHALLSAQFQFRSHIQGPGLWRANPQLAKNKYFQTALTKALDEFHLNLVDSQNTPQETWDLLKPLVRTIAQKHGRRSSEWRQRVLNDYNENATNSCVLINKQVFETFAFLSSNK